MNDRAVNDKMNPTVQTYFLAIIATILILFALKAATIATMPLAFSIFTAMLLFPVYQWLNGQFSHRLRWLAITLTMSIFILILVIVIVVVWISIDTISQQAPQYQSTLKQMQTNIMNWMNNHNIPIDQEALQAAGLRQRSLQILTTFIKSAWEIAAFIVLVFFFTLLLLLEWHEWKERTVHALGPQQADTVYDTIQVISEKVRHYLLVRTFTSFLAAVFQGGWLFYFGVDFAFLWAVLIFFLNYIPNVGSILAVIPPTLVALIQMGFAKSFGVIAGLTIIDQIIGNYIDPRLMGHRLRVSPVVILFSLLLWSWVWGIGGAILSVPITVALTVSFAHIPALRPLALMISRSDDMQDLRKDTHKNG